MLLDSERDLKCVAQALSAVYKNTKNGCCALIKPTFSPWSQKKHHTIPAEVLPNDSEALLCFDDFEVKNPVCNLKSAEMVGIYKKTR